MALSKDALARNFITPDEASKKWCPHVRNLHEIKGIPAASATTSYNADRTHNKCISTNCMMWHSETTTTGCCGLSNTLNVGV